MPCLEIVLPKLNREKKQQLAEGLTEVFCSVTGHDASIFGILFQEYDKDGASFGGKLYGEHGTAPYVHFVLYCTRLMRTQKQNLVDALSKTFVETLKEPSWLPIIHLCEHPYDNVGFNRKLLSDQFEECSKRKFYYELPKD
ncbi:MAG: tautomerase family protein [Deltaproteobacteria bacterium]|nr:tautomerase family protein [Deltaproteobacteria bacterium]